jgi:hypothetical protein
LKDAICLEEAIKSVQIRLVRVIRVAISPIPQPNRRIPYEFRTGPTFQKEYGIIEILNHFVHFGGKNFFLATIGKNGAIGREWRNEKLN